LNYSDISDAIPSKSSPELIEDLIVLIEEAKIDIVGNVEDLESTIPKKKDSEESVFIDDSLKTYMHQIGKSFITK